MRAVIVPFLLLFLAYLLLWAAGKEGRAQLWAAVRPHVLPAALFFLVALMGVLLAFNGGFIKFL